MNIRIRSIIQIVLLVCLTIYAIYAVNFLPSDPGPLCELQDRVPTNELVYVNHARCRMGCRDINKKLVEKVYQEGTVNCDKSSYKNGHARYALEKRDKRGDKIRVIVEDDDGKHLIITVIRLGQEDHCTCS
ncbi:MAG TPA: DUF4258 domain-containing protein [Bacteroidetes bacterium]|nr:DUF4258 domain-containing protein [Bacteroidota bacterium]